MPLMTFEAFRRATAPPHLVKGKNMQSNGHVSAGEVGMPITAPADGSEEAETPTVDLAGWAVGEIEYPFAEVKRQIDERIFAAIDAFVRERFPIMVTTPKEAIAFLVREGLITAEQARTDLEEDE
jgi:hypothetical protein